MKTALLKNMACICSCLLACRFTAQGASIAYSRGTHLNEVIGWVTVSSNFSVWVIDPDAPSPAPVQVSPVETPARLMPSWSPMQTDIVFASNRGYDHSIDPSPWLDLWTMSKMGANLARLTAEVGHNWTPAWSPDGRYIAFASTRDPVSGTNSMGDEVYYFNIWIMEANGAHPRLLYTEARRPGA